MASSQASDPLAAKKGAEAGPHKPRAQKRSRVNPETGSYSSKCSKEDDNIFMEDDDGDMGNSDTDSSTDYPNHVEIKPDPSTLRMLRQSERSMDGEYGDDSELESNDNDQDRFSINSHKAKRRGGRVRDEVWKYFHPVGNNMWKCDECPYTLCRPQADRLRKHKLKCVLRSQCESPVSVPDSGSAKKLLKAKDPSLTLLKDLELSNLSNQCKLTSTNGITHQLRRIADALEEANKLKKLKLGLDPHVPFDGEQSKRK